MILAGAVKAWDHAKVRKMGYEKRRQKSVYPCRCGDDLL
jgi:hypothetical protein